MNMRVAEFSLSWALDMPAFLPKCPIKLRAEWERSEEKEWRRFPMMIIGLIERNRVRRNSIV
jgi:hypothetical protein